MNETTFMEYVRRFNEEDDTAFDDYLHPQMHMKNGTLEFTGIDGMKHHYRDLIWGNFHEELNIRRFVGQGDRLAIQMNTFFTARKDMEQSLFGPVSRGDVFEFNGLVMYELENELFRDILVAYNSFVYTDVTGASRELGIPH